MSKKLFVGGLPFTMSDVDFRKSFEEFGRVNEAVVINDRETGRSRGFGFVTFAEEIAAGKAQARMDASTLDGRKITVTFAEESATRRPGPSAGRREPPPAGPFPEGATKLFVGGLSWEVDGDGLREAFVEFGTVREARVVMDRETNQSKGFGFVTFVDTEDAERAARAMNGRKIAGRSVRVNAAEDKPRSAGTPSSSPRDPRRSGERGAVSQEASPTRGPSQATFPQPSLPLGNSGSTNPDVSSTTSRRRALPPERELVDVAARERLGPVKTQPWGDDAEKGGQRAPGRRGGGREGGRGADR